MPATLPPECGCDSEKVEAVHGYLIRSFPTYHLLHFHAPTILMRAGLPAPHADHHVVRLERDGIQPYYAILTADFQKQPREWIANLLRRWNLAQALGAHRIVIVDDDGVSSL